MKFLGDLVKVAEGKYRVGLIHNMPFDPVHGLGKSEEELRQIGVLVEDLPQPEIREGKIAVLYCNPATNTVYYEYEDGPLTEQERIVMLEQAILELTILLGGGN